MPPEHTAPTEKISALPHSVYLDFIRGVAERIVMNAGSESLRLQADPNARAVSGNKSDGSDVTPTDIRLNELITQQLRARFPGHVVFSEEGNQWQSLEGSELNNRLVWINDPLDGTTNFSNGNDQFGMLMGLTHHRRSILGAVYMPRSRQLVSAALGRGVFLNGQRQDFSTRDPNPARLTVSTSSYGAEDDEKFSRLVASLGQPLKLRNSAARALALVRGDIDVHVSGSPAKERATGAVFHNSSQWDICATDAILAEMGGALTDLEGKPILYGTPDPSNERGLILARTRAILERALAAIQACGISIP